MRYLCIRLSGVLVAASSATGDVVEYENDARPLWFQAVGGESNVTTLNFDELPNNTTVSNHYGDLGVTFEGFNYTVGGSTSFEDGWGLNIFNGNHLYFDEPINWIAADIRGNVVFELYDNGTLFYTSDVFGPGADEIRFGGIVSDRAFDQVRVFDPIDFVTALDDLHFGPIIAVPAPGILMPFALILGLRRRRRRR